MVLPAGGIGGFRDRRAARKPHRWQHLRTGDDGRFLHLAQPCGGHLEITVVGERLVDGAGELRLVELGEPTGGDAAFVARGGFVPGSRGANGQVIHGCGETP